MLKWFFVVPVVLANLWAIGIFTGHSQRFGRWQERLARRSGRVHRQEAMRYAFEYLIVKWTGAAQAEPDTNAYDEGCWPYLVAIAIIGFTLIAVFLAFAGTIR